MAADWYNSYNPRKAIGHSGNCRCKACNRIGKEYDAALERRAPKPDKVRTQAQPQAKEKKSMLDQLMSFDERMADSYNLDSMVGLLAYGELVLKTYADNSLEAPSRLTDNVALIKTAVDRQRQDNLEKALKEADRELEALKTREERKGDLATRRAEILKKLGRG